MAERENITKLDFRRVISDRGTYSAGVREISRVGKPTTQMVVSRSPSYIIDHKSTSSTSVIWSATETIIRLSPRKHPGPRATVVTHKVADRNGPFDFHKSDWLGSSFCLRWLVWLRNLMWSRGTVGYSLYNYSLYIGSVKKTAKTHLVTALKRSCPAVSQICSLIFWPDTSIIRVPNSTPIVCGQSGITGDKKEGYKSTRRTDFGSSVLMATVSSTRKRRSGKKRYLYFGGRVGVRPRAGCRKRQPHQIITFHIVLVLSKEADWGVNQFMTNSYGSSQRSEYKVLVAMELQCTVLQRHI